jgi:hypothetical protein
MAKRETHVGDLPWGWWLRASRGALEDEDGRRWQSVREAFWQGRLGFPAPHVAEEQRELLLRVLTAIDACWMKGAEHRHDLFDGNMVFWHFYLCWLSSIGLTERDSRSQALNAPLTAEGRSVMLMLRATRDPEWEEVPWAELVDALDSARRSPAEDAREAALSAFESTIGQRRHLFARERVGRSHLVTLTRLVADARMPVHRVIWSQSFTDRRDLNEFFGWLVERLHCWDDWGNLAHRSGAEALTHRFFTLLVERAG